MIDILCSLMLLLGPRMLHLATFTSDLNNDSVYFVLKPCIFISQFRDKKKLAKELNLKIGLAGGAQAREKELAHIKIQMKVAALSLIAIPGSTCPNDDGSCPLTPTPTNQSGFVSNKTTVTRCHRNHRSPPMLELPEEKVHIAPQAPRYHSIVLLRVRHESIAHRGDLSP